MKRVRSALGLERLIVPDIVERVKFRGLLQQMAI
jgi:hypothetical protein